MSTDHVSIRVWVCDAVRYDQPRDRPILADDRHTVFELIAYEVNQEMDPSTSTPTRRVVHTPLTLKTPLVYGQGIKLCCSFPIARCNNRKKVSGPLGTLCGNSVRGEPIGRGRGTARDSRESAAGELLFSSQF